jgi:TNF receptor-associated protein 1
LEQLDAKGGGSVDKNIIGQFGVGFYSAFMVADRIDVYTQSYKADSPAYKWSSDGSDFTSVVKLRIGESFIQRLVIFFLNYNID